MGLVQNDVFGMLTPKVQSKPDFEQNVGKMSEFLIAKLLDFKIFRNTSEVHLAGEGVLCTGGRSVDTSTRQRVDASTRGCVDASTRRPVDASTRTRRRVDVSTRQGVDALTR